MCNIWLFLHLVYVHYKWYYKYKLRKEKTGGQTHESISGRGQGNKVNYRHSGYDTRSGKKSRAGFHNKRSLAETPQGVSRGQPPGSDDGRLEKKPVAGPPDHAAGTNQKKER